jgi:hypothetical protein
MEVVENSLGVIPEVTVSSTDLGGSSKYSIGTLKTEVEKGFMSTAVGHELVGTKDLGNSNPVSGDLCEG